MPSICFYFQVHQPYRMRHYPMFEVGYGKEYFDVKVNRDTCRKVARKCYLPANAMMLELIEKYPGAFKISYSISGVAIEQFAEYAPEVLESFQKLAATGCVEMIDETYYHSLSGVFDGVDFREQVAKHRETIRHYFHVTPTTFRNTELIYSDGIADMVESMGYTAMLAEGADHVMDWRSPNFVYEPANGKGMKLLVKNYKLSDDIAFRFSQRSWESYPLTADKFASWVQTLDGGADTINLFMDYETIGEHQWEDTGIFEFFRALPEAVWHNTGFDFATPSEVARRYPPVAKLSVPNAMSWADAERDLSAWLGNPMQDDTVAWVYRLGKRVKDLNDPHLLHTWRKLQTSDHFYYMCTKFWSDGDVHKYFSAYDSPHDSYTIMNNVLTDLEMRLDDKAPKKKVVAPHWVESAPAAPPKAVKPAARAKKKPVLAKK